MSSRPSDDDLAKLEWVTVYSDQNDTLGWPLLPNMDYRHGFPMPTYSAEVLDELPEELKNTMLERFRAATFEALTRMDIEDAEHWMRTEQPPAPELEQPAKKRRWWHR